MSLPICTVSTNNIQNLPDAPNLPPDELKQKFDKAGKDLKDYINEVLLSAVENLVKEEKKNIETSINNKILEDNKRKYHIGKIIIDTSNTNPNKYLGFGTWELWGSGRVPVGVDTQNAKFDTVEKTGGEETHTLIMEEIPDHLHEISLTYGTVLPDNWGNEGKIAAGAAGNGWCTNTKATTSGAGSGKEHNNLQPFITCYMWKRTA